MRLCLDHRDGELLIELDNNLVPDAPPAAAPAPVCSDWVNAPPPWAGRVRAGADGRRWRVRAALPVPAREGALREHAAEKVRVVVADDQAAIRTGLVMILESAPDIEVVGEAGDGLAAVALARAERPDVVLMDIRMPGIDGIEATRRLVDATGSCEVLVLTTFDLDEYVDSALAAGAAGFLLKSVDAPALLAAVRAVARGDGVLAPEITRRVISRLAAPARKPEPPPASTT